MELHASAAAALFGCIVLLVASLAAGAPVLIWRSCSQREPFRGAWAYFGRGQQRGPRVPSATCDAEHGNPGGSSSGETDSDMPELIPVTLPSVPSLPSLPSMPSLPSCDHLLEDLELSSPCGLHGARVLGARSFSSCWAPAALAGALKAASASTDDDDAGDLLVSPQSDEEPVQCWCKDQRYLQEALDLASEPEANGLHSRPWLWDAAEPCPWPGHAGTWQEPDHNPLMTLNRPESLASAASLASAVPVASVGSFHDDEFESLRDAKCGGLAVQLAHIVVDHPLRVIAAWSLVFAAACCFAPRLLEEVQASYDPEPGMPSFRAKEAMERHFPGLADQTVDSVLFSLEPDADHFHGQLALLQSADALEAALQALRREHPGLLAETRSWRANQGAGESAKSYVSQDGRTCLLQVVWAAAGPKARRGLLRVAAQLLAEVQRLNHTYAPQGLRITATGPHMLMLAAQAQARQDIGVHSLMFLPLAVFAMHTHLRRWELLPLPAICSMVALAVSFAVAYLVAMHWVMDQNVPTLLAFLCISLCIDWSFFLLARFREEEAPRGHAGAIVAALSRTGATIALSGGLIVVCSMCMMLMPLAIASNAAGGAIAVGAALSCCLTLLPACLAALPRCFAAAGAGAQGSGEPKPTESGPASAQVQEGQTLWYIWACLVTRFPCNIVVLLSLAIALIPAVLKLAAYEPAVGNQLCLPPAEPALLAAAQLRTGLPAAPRLEAQMYVLLEANPGCAEGVRSEGYFDTTCAAAQGLLGLSQPARPVEAADLLGVAFFNPPTSTKSRCISWRTHFQTMEEAQAAMTGNFTPSGHLLLTGRTRNLVNIPGDQLMQYRMLYGQLWSRCVSSDERASLLVVRLSWDAVTWDGFRLVQALRQMLAELSALSAGKSSAPCSKVQAWELSEAGIWYDYVVASVGKLPWAVGLACLATAPLMAVCFHSAVAPCKLLLTVGLPVAWVYAAAIWCFQDGLLDALGLDLPMHSSGGLHWMVPCSTSMLLLALALDYNVFYLGRAFEFRKAGVSDVEAIRQSLASTGPVITCAGLIFAAEFSGLLLSEAALSRQGGFVVVLGVLLDTFVVRSCLTPAVLSLGTQWNWWPASMPQLAAAAGEEELSPVMGSTDTELPLTRMAEFSAEDCPMGDGL